MPFPTIDGVRTLEIGTPGEMRGHLNRLILSGAKRATAGLLVDYVREDEPLEVAGDILALIDDESRAIAIVKVERVMTMRFASVPWEFAQAEGEGDESIEDWRDGHQAYWTSAGEVVDDETLVVLVWFQLMDAKTHS